jgi:hypothetical protein
MDLLNRYKDNRKKVNFTNSVEKTLTKESTFSSISKHTLYQTQRNMDGYCKIEFYLTFNKAGLPVSFIEEKKCCEGVIKWNF